MHAISIGAGLSFKNLIGKRDSLPPAATSPPSDTNSPVEPGGARSGYFSIQDNGLGIEPQIPGAQIFGNIHSVLHHRDRISPGTGNGSWRSARGLLNAAGGRLLGRIRTRKRFDRFYFTVSLRENLRGKDRGPEDVFRFFEPRDVADRGKGVGSGRISGHC